MSYSRDRITKACACIRKACYNAISKATDKVLVEFPEANRSPETAAMLYRLVAAESANALNMFLAGFHDELDNALDAAYEEDLAAEIEMLTKPEVL